MEEPHFVDNKCPEALFSSYLEEECTPALVIPIYDTRHEKTDLKVFVVRGWLQSNIVNII